MFLFNEMMGPPFKVNYLIILDIPVDFQFSDNEI